MRRSRRGDAAGARTRAKAAFIEAESLAGAAESWSRGELDSRSRSSDARRTYRAATAAAVRAGEREVLERELPAIRAPGPRRKAWAHPSSPPTFTSAAREQAELEAASPPAS